MCVWVCVCATAWRENICPTDCTSVSVALFPLFMNICESESQCASTTTHSRHLTLYLRSVNHKNLVSGNNWVGRPRSSWPRGLMDGQFQQQEIIAACQPPPIQSLICVCPLPACHKWPQGHAFHFIVPKPRGRECVWVLSFRRLVSLHPLLKDSPPVHLHHHAF